MSHPARKRFSAAEVLSQVFLTLLLCRLGGRRLVTRGNGHRRATRRRIGWARLLESQSLFVSSVPWVYKGQLQRVKSLEHSDRRRFVPALYFGDIITREGQSPR